MTKTNEEIGDEAFLRARADTIKAANKVGLTLPHVMKRLKESTDAKESKFFQHEGKVTAKRTVIAHQTRLAATKLGLDILGATPPKNHKHELSGSIDHKVTGNMDLKALKDAITKDPADK